MAIKNFDGGEWGSKTKNKLNQLIEALNAADMFDGGLPPYTSGSGVNIDVAHEISVTKKTGFKNILLNGDERINQRDFGGTWVDGEYGFDGWKGHANGKEQIIEQKNISDGEYTLSWQGGGTGIFNGTTAQSPITETITVVGNMSVVVPEAAQYMQLERGPDATDFELRDETIDQAMAEARYQIIDTWAVTGYASAAGQTAVIYSYGNFKTKMRDVPQVSIPSSSAWSLNNTSTPTLRRRTMHGIELQGSSTTSGRAFASLLGGNKIILDADL